MGRIILVLCLLIGFAAQAQYPPGYTGINQRYDWFLGKFRGLHVPGKGADDTTFLTSQWRGAGAVVVDTVNNKFYFWSGGQWREAGGGGLGSGVITPPEITSNENNYNPTGLAAATTVRISADAARNITGLEGGVEGRVVVLQNVGTGDITLTAQDGDSDPENQFSQAIYLEDGLGVIALRYDGVLEKWVPLTSPFKFGGEDALGVDGGRQFDANNEDFEIFNFGSAYIRLEEEIETQNGGIDILRDGGSPRTSVYATDDAVGSARISMTPTVTQLQTNNTTNTEYGIIYIKKDTVVLYAKDYAADGEPSSYITLDPTHAHVYGDSSWTEWSNDEGIEEYPWLGRYRIDSLQEHLASDTVDLKLMFWKYDTDPDEMGVVYQMNLQDFIALLPGGGGSGTVTEVTATDANGFNFTVTDGTTTPNITLETTVSNDQLVVANAGDIIGYGSLTFTDADDVATLTVGESGGSRGQIVFQNATNSYTLSAPGSGTNVLELPTNAGTEGQVLTKGSANTSSWQDAGGVSMGYSLFADTLKSGSTVLSITPRYTLFDDFIGSNNATGSWSLIGTTSGGAVGIFNGNPTNGTGTGYMRLRTGTGTTGFAMLASQGSTTNQLGLVDANKVVRWGVYNVNINDLSDGTDTYTFDAGISLSSVTNNQIVFSYTHSVNSGAWVCTSRTGTTPESTNTAVTVVVDTEYDLEFELYDNQVRFWINGTLVATHTTSIPAAGVALYGTMIRILKSAGSTERDCFIDGYKFRVEHENAVQN